MPHLLAKISSVIAGPRSFVATLDRQWHPFMSAYPLQVGDEPLLSSSFSDSILTAAITRIASLSSSISSIRDCETLSREVTACSRSSRINGRWNRWKAGSSSSSDSFDLTFGTLARGIVMQTADTEGEARAAFSNSANCV